MKSITPQQQLNGFLAKYSPEIQKLARPILARMRKRLPHAIQMVYDNYNALVVGFCPTERPSEAVFSIALYPDHISLVFIWGAALTDSEKRLRGSGNQVRHVRLENAATLDEPWLQALMEQAIEKAPKPFDPKQRGKLIIKAISAKQRPRRK
jgi:hypothetical protein